MINPIYSPAAFSPLAQGLLTNRYLDGVPENSRMVQSKFLRREVLTDELLQKIKALNELTVQRGQTLAETSLAWLLKDTKVTSVIVGASSVTQLDDNLKALDNICFSTDEINGIYRILKE